MADVYPTGERIRAVSRRPVSDRFGLAVATAVGMVSITGCGAPASTDVEQVNVTIANLSDAALDPESFQSFFVAGSAPDESQRHRYREYFYEMDPPDISGDSATAVVHMVDAAGEVEGAKVWVFSKVDTQWKIRQAPLP